MALPTALSAQTMGIAALFTLLILVMFYLGDLMGRLSPILLRACSLAALAVAAVLYTGSRGWHDPRDYLIRLAVFLAMHLIVCLITDHMFLHRQMISNYGVLLSTMFMILMMPAFFGEAAGIRFLLLALLVMAGFLFMVRQVRRKRSLVWILALAASGTACLFCRQLLPALMTVCIIYLFELLRRPSARIAVAAGCSAAVFAAETVLFLTGHMPQAVLDRTPDPASLPVLQDAVLSESFLAILAVLLFAGTVLCPFIRYFVMKRRIGTTELYPLIYAVAGMALYTLEGTGPAASGTDLRAALYLCSLVPLCAAAFGALYERCADDFDLAGIFAVRGEDEDGEDTAAADEKDSSMDDTGKIAAALLAEALAIDAAAGAAGTSSGTEDAGRPHTGGDRPLSKQDEEIIDSMFRGSRDTEPFDFIDPYEEES